MPEMDLINGWKIYQHPTFEQPFSKLLKDVEHLKEKDPEGYHKKAYVKLLAAVVKAIRMIAENPEAPEFRQGKTLGPPNKGWSREKFGAGRYRLFFRYDSASRIIVLGWLNGEDTLRTYGSMSDAYYVFGKMLKAGHPPGDWALLLAEAQKP